MVVWLFPYLPLSRRVTIGPWQVVPRGDLADDDASSPEVAQHARDVARLYRLPGDGRGFGAFVRGEEERVGEEFENAALGRLYQTVVAAMLDENPSRADAEFADHNAGHRICTTENVQLFGHGVDADSYTAYATGVMVTTFAGGPRVGESEDVIEPPNEMTLPLMRPQMDEVYAAALYDVLTDLDEDGPDLPGAIRWLEVSWINARAVRVEARVLALRAGFDVLFGGAATAAIRGQLSALLDDENAPRTRRQWTYHGNHREADLTDLEWWFQSFALLRNKIAHGGTVDPAELDFEDGIPHIWHAERNLRRAIKQIVANMGHEDVLLDPFERIARRFGELDGADDGAA